MVDRRDFVIGLLGAGAFGTAEFLRPRRRVRLFPTGTLEDIVPRRFGTWTELPGGNIITPVTPNSLSDRLYSGTISRLYVEPGVSNRAIMLLVAYGGEQSDMLQLHRPETCYPAVGLEITSRQLGAIALPGGQTLPATRLTAGTVNRHESIIYWTRLGEEFPRSGSEQRRDRLKTAMQGVIGDGILVRASTVSSGSASEDFAYVERFLHDFVGALPQGARPGFIGTRRASAIA